MIKEADIRYNKYIKRMPEIGGFLIMPMSWACRLSILFTIALVLAYGIIQHFSIPMIIALLVGTGWLVFLFLLPFLGAAPTLWRMFRPKWRGWRIFLRGIYAWVANAVKVTSMIIIACVILLPVGYGMSFIDYKWKVNISEKNIIRIYLEDEKIYEGKKAFTEIIKHEFIKPEDKVHDRTKVIIYKKLFPYSVIDKTYVGKNIKVEPSPSPSR